MKLKNLTSIVLKLIKSLEIGGVVVSNKQPISGEFNTFFSGIGTSLAALLGKYIVQIYLLHLHS